MRRFRITLVVLALLAAVSAWLLLSRRSGTYSRSDVEFAVPDTSLILSVEIRDGERRAILTRHADSWKLNGLAPVRTDRMSGMLVLLSRLEVISPVSRSRSARISRQLQEAGKQVVIRLSRGEDREYLVFHDTAETDATYMMLDDADTPFRMGVKGYRRRDLAALYRADERYWRDNVLLNFLPDEIAAIRLQNNRDPGHTFQLARNTEGGFELATGPVPGEWSEPVAGKLRQYLGYFYGVRFEDYAFVHPDDPSPYAYDETPAYVLEVTTVAGLRTSLEFFPVFTADDSGSKKMDLNVLYVKISDGNDMVMSNYLEIDPLLKDPGYFLSR